LRGDRVYHFSLWLAIRSTVTLRIGKKAMPRGKIVAIITGAISIILALAYLLLVQLLDFRGEMIPAPISQLPQSMEVAHIPAIQAIVDMQNLV
jgi:hypothetical protein